MAKILINAIISFILTFFYCYVGANCIKTAIDAFNKNKFGIFGFEIMLSVAIAALIFNRWV